MIPKELEGTQFARPIRAFEELGWQFFAGGQTCPHLSKPNGRSASWRVGPRLPEDTDIRYSRDRMIKAGQYLGWVSGDGEFVSVGGFDSPDMGAFLYMQKGQPNDRR